MISIQSVQPISDYANGRAQVRSYKPYQPCVLDTIVLPLPQTPVRHHIPRPQAAGFASN